MTTQNLNNTLAGGVGITGFLAMLFIALKLTGNLDWAWKWVLAPLWIPAAVALVALVGLFLFMLGKDIRELD